MKSSTAALAFPPTLAPTYPEGGVLLVVAGIVKDALGGHGQACVLRQSRHPVLMFVQIFLKEGKTLLRFKGKNTTLQTEV